MSNKFMPFLVIGGGLFLLSNVEGNTTSVPVNYSTGNYNGIQPYQPIPSLGPAVAAGKSDLEKDSEALMHQILINGAEMRGLHVPLQSGGYTDSGHQNTLIGDMVHQMRHQGAIQQQTLNQANEFIIQCDKIQPPKPPVCN